MKKGNETILEAACLIAKSSGAKAILVASDFLERDSIKVPSDSCPIILIHQRSQEKGGVKDSSQARGVSDHVIELPSVTMTRMGRVKMGMVLALSKKLVQVGDKVVFVNGIPGGKGLDSILLLDTERETEVMTTQGIKGIAECVTPEVFQEILELSLELATRGREGKPVGTTFILGDEQEVLRHSKQMIINPFKGYDDEERNILTRKLRETLREFAAIDGAIIISGDGHVMTAGRYLAASLDESATPRGLGSRHIAAAGITAITRAIAMVISESTGDIRIFKNGKILVEMEKQIKIPMIS